MAHGVGTVVIEGDPTDFEEVVKSSGEIQTGRSAFLTQSAGSIG